MGRPTNFNKTVAHLTKQIVAEQSLTFFHKQQKCLFAKAALH